MKLIIAGSRTLKMVRPTSLIDSLLSSFLENSEIEEIVSGGCQSGPDSWAKDSCEYFDCNYKEFKADWNTHGKSVGPIRNKEMAEYSDALLLIWDGQSKGSKSMKESMIKLGKPIFEVIIKHCSYTP